MRIREAREEKKGEETRREKGGEKRRSSHVTDQFSPTKTMKVVVIALPAREEDGSAREEGVRVGSGRAGEASCRIALPIES